MKSDESCRKLFSCKELAGHTSAGTGFPKITERQAKACRHRPTPLNCEGPNGVFRIVEVIRYSVALRNSARNRFPLTVTLNADPRSGQPGSNRVLAKTA